MKENIADKPGEIFSIQALRGIAAILVVFCHSSQFMTIAFNLSIERYFGHCFGNFGVDIFFVISGFIMVYISRDHFGQKNAIFPFLIRRVIRIFPIYWFVTLVVLLVIIPSGIGLYDFPGSHNATMAKDGYYVLESFLLIPVFYAGQQVNPVVGVAWTLIYEVFFYVIFSISLLFHRKWSLKILSVVFGFLVILFFIVSSAYWHINTESLTYQYIIFYGDNIILEFLLGCYIANLYLSKNFLRNKISILVILFSTFMFIVFYHPGVWHRVFGLHISEYILDVLNYRIIAWGIPAALLVYGVISLEARKAFKVPKILVMLGDASYSIYLVHFSIFIILFIALFKQLEERLYWIPGNGSVFVVWFFCIVLGYTVYRYVELPLLSSMKKYILRRIKS